MGTNDVTGSQYPAIQRDDRLFEGFVEFCKSQPPEKPVNHYEWESCAIGEFAEHLGNPFDTLDFCEWPKKVLGTGKIYDSFNQGLSGKNYGELVSTLEIKE